MHHCNRGKLANVLVPFRRNAIPRFRQSILCVFLAQGMVNLQYWEWRRARTEEDQNLFLEREVTRALEANPLPSLGE